MPPQLSSLPTEWQYTVDVSGAVDMQHVGGAMLATKP